LRCVDRSHSCCAQTPAGIVRTQTADNRSDSIRRHCERRSALFSGRERPVTQRSMRALRASRRGGEAVRDRARVFCSPGARDLPHAECRKRRSLVAMARGLVRRLGLSKRHDASRSARLAQACKGAASARGRAHVRAAWALRRSREGVRLVRGLDDLCDASRHSLTFVALLASACPVDRKSERYGPAQRQRSRHSCGPQRRISRVAATANGLNCDKHCRRCAEGNLEYAKKHDESSRNGRSPPRSRGGAGVKSPAILMSPTVDLTRSGASMTQRVDRDRICTPAMPSVCLGLPLRG
jgi:hypothetical protein